MYRQPGGSNERGGKVIKVKVSDFTRWSVELPFSGAEWREVMLSGAEWGLVALWDSPIR